MGLVVLVVGAMFLADQVDFLGFDRNVPVWPWILLIFGLARVGEWRSGGRERVKRSAAWFLLLGGWGLVTEYRLLGVSYDGTWPLLVVGVGALMVLDSQAPQVEETSKDGRS
jgi:hypothetical protein